MNRERCLQTESSSYTEADPLTSIWRQTLELHSQIAWCEDRHYFQYDRRDAHVVLFYFIAAIFPPCADGFSAVEERQTDGQNTGVDAVSRNFSVPRVPLAASWDFCTSPLMYERRKLYATEKNCQTCILGVSKIDASRFWPLFRFVTPEF